MKMRRIMVATDFSDCSAAALRYATQLARDLHADLVIVHVEHGPSSHVERREEGQYESDDALARAALRNVRPHDPFVHYHHRLLTGDPAAEIVRFGARQRVDMIVMGTHGRSGLARILMGSVAEEVMRNAGCPVLTVREGVVENETVAAGEEQE